ncbi:MAG: HD domain-containing protein [Lachnospiraceae bacterium]|nr:HD domain-containing protein [Lachnospiraceae bacterium]
MIAKAVEQIAEGDVLARDVILDGTILIPTGTAVKTDYIQNLKELNIELIYVEEQNGPDSWDILPHHLMVNIYPKVTDMLQNLRHDNIDSLKEFIPIADSILDEVYKSFDTNCKTHVSERNPDIALHTIYGCALVCMVGKCMGKKKAEMRESARGMIFHDIGYRYVATPYENINPEKLSPGEVFDLKKHTIYGFSALEGVSWLSDEAKRIVLSHHERLDGTGYPLKQKKLNDDIRIACVCDRFDTIICGIGCKISVPKIAIETLRSRDSGLDNRIIDILEDHITFD